jgi:serine/threonine protein kinase
LYAVVALLRFRSGERPSIEELVTRHPELADQIRELLPALAMVERELTIDRERGSYGPQPPPASLKERRLGDYRILREIGRGGMRVVYEAEQVSLGRKVALKVLPSQVAEDRQALERFRRDAKLAARLHHTNILPVYEVGQEDDVARYAMQFIQGQGLDAVIIELRQVLDRAGSRPGTEASSGDQSLRPRRAHCRQRASTRTLGETVEISRQLQYILTG